MIRTCSIIYRNKFAGLNLCKTQKTLCLLLQFVFFQTETECGIFNTSTLMYHNKYELCAGFKLPYPKMKVYLRKLKKSKDGGSKKKSYVFKYLMEQKNPVISSLWFKWNISGKCLEKISVE